jgi:KDO2-lipid IV(A) lauroyltransferase
MRPLPPFLLEIRYQFLRSAIRLIRHLPYRFILYLFRFLAMIAWLVDPFHRKIAYIQMSSALSLRKPWRLVLKVFMNQADILIDTIKYAYMNIEEIRAKIVVEGKEHLGEALARGRGLLLFTGHIGNWETLSHFSRILGVEFCIMADVRNDPRLDSIIDDIRSRSGATILPPKGKALMLIKELRKGRTIGMVVDSRGDLKDGLFCPIFGMPAPTNPAPAFIAIKGNALVLPVYIVKLHGTYHIRILKAVDAADFGEGSGAIQALSDFMQSTLASVVEQYPDQWFWLYSRWVTRSAMRSIMRRKLDFKGYVLQQSTRK